jgi:hypothetical protein
LNLRLPAPKAGALPGCATPRSQRFCTLVVPPSRSRARRPPLARSPRPRLDEAWRARQYRGPSQAEGADHPSALDKVLLVVRRDEHARERIDRIGRVGGVRTLVDRRRGERRTQDNGASPIQTRRTERRRQTWVDDALASVGAAFARVESRGAHTLHVTTELIGGRWYGVLYIAGRRRRR